MAKKHPDIKFLVGDGVDANAPNIVDRVCLALSSKGVATKEIEEFRSECEGADYSQLQQIVSSWVEVI